MSKALKEPTQGNKILKLDDAVGAGGGKLKAKGPHQPMQALVVARVSYTLLSNVVRLRRDARQDHEAQKFNVERVSQQDVAKAGGGPPPED